ncbi:hypothetical protein MKW94_022845 [Papaver nudicaule]|uniref:Uncharacterized protein n=1 Tax=Papaver nudicaule TaxID=74823 RepID=A0AA41UXA5_PAPNU|nr:hypothetical protein [Papaver nudicaule]
MILHRSNNSLRVITFFAIFFKDFSENLGIRVFHAHTEGEGIYYLGFLVFFRGEPFIDGRAVPYDAKNHEEWVRNNARANERSIRNDRPRNSDKSRNFERRRENMQSRDFQPNQPGSPPGAMPHNPNMQSPGGIPPNPDMQNPVPNMGGMPPNSNMHPNMGGPPGVNMQPNMGGMQHNAYAQNKMGGMTPNANMRGPPSPNAGYYNSTPHNGGGQYRDAPPQGGGAPYQGGPPRDFNPRGNYQ